jgi:hypothetical protein
LTGRSSPRSSIAPDLLVRLGERKLPMIDHAIAQKLSRSAVDEVAQRFSHRKTS